MTLSRIYVFFFIFIFLFGCQKKTDENPEDSHLYKTTLNKKLRSTRSIDTLSVWLSDFSNQGDKIGEMLCLKQLGALLRENSRFSEAIAFHRNGLRIALHLKDTCEIIQAYNNLGTDFRRMGSLVEASGYHFDALKYAEKHSQHSTPTGIKNKVVSLNGIGNVCLTLNQNDEAEQYFREALKGETQLQSSIGRAINYANLGAVFENRQLYDSAVVYYEKSLQENRQAKSNMGISLCLVHLGGIYKQQQMYYLAKKKYTEAYQLMENAPDKWHWLSSCISLAEIYLLMGDTENFNKYISLAEKNSKEIKATEYLVDIYRLKYKQNQEIGNYLQALNYYKKSKHLKDSIVGVEKTNRFADLRIGYEREQSEHKLQEIELKSQIQQQKEQQKTYFFLILFFFFIFLSLILYYAYRQRMRSNAILKQAEKNRSDFFTNITHEFRTPLTVIKGFNKQLQQDKDLTETEKNTFMNAINRQSNILLKTVNQLLDLARLQAGIDNPQWRNGDIVSYVQQRVDSFKPYAKEKNISLFLETDLDTLNMDFIPSYIEKIISNLLSTTIKFSEEDSSIYFKIGEGRSSEEVVFQIGKPTMGASDSELKCIFELFCQGEKQENASTIGVGLFLTKVLIDKMLGQVHMQSESEQDISLNVTLPTRNGQLTYVKPIERETKIDDFNPEMYCDMPFEYQPKRALTSSVPLILLIEDNEDVLLYLETLLKDKYHIIKAANGLEGWEKAKKYVPDLIITDLMLPILDGYEICKSVKNNDLLHHIPVVMLTAKSTEEDRIKGFRYGADAYIYKPFQGEELRIRIEKIFENRQLLKQKYVNLVSDTIQENKSNDDKNVVFLQKVNSVIYKELKNPNINASFLADKMLVSLSQLSRKLIALTGCSTATYITKVKIKEAKKLLRTTSMNVSEVADACGFSDLNYFSRVFKKETGQSPSQFQKL